MAQTHKHACTHSQTLSTYNQAYTLTCTHTHTRARAYTPSTYMHAHQAHTHTHASTHMQIQTQIHASTYIARAVRDEHKHIHKSCISYAAYVLLYAYKMKFINFTYTLAP